jgi:3-hydroxyacyl-CoA dehydrogenase/enoyl-CoA hydratase/3-hydroxybutyryl-CoA epimerase
MTRKVGVLGAGMMGAGIAFVSASAGIDVVLKDIDLAAAEKARRTRRRCWTRKLPGQMTAEQREAVLARIHPRSDADLAGCD